MSRCRILILGSLAHPNKTTNKTAVFVSPRIVYIRIY
jgi:hypothetical protein